MAYAFVGSATNSANGNTVTYSPTAGHLVVVMVGSSGGGGNPTVTVSDNKSSSYSTAKATAGIGATGYFQSAFYLANAPSGITTITCTFNGGTPGQTNILVAEYSGIATTTPLIVASAINAQASPGTGANAVISPTVNVTSQPAALLGFSYDVNQNHQASAGTSPLTFTARYGTASNDGLFLEDARVTATGNTNTASTAGTGTDSFGTIAMAFSEAASGTVYTLTAAQGSFSLTGEAAVRDIGLPVAEGAFSLTGHAATAAYGLGANEGPFSLSGFGATLNWSGASVTSSGAAAHLGHLSLGFGISL